MPGTAGPEGDGPGAIGKVVSGFDELGPAGFGPDGLGPVPDGTGPVSDGAGPLVGPD